MNFEDFFRAARGTSDAPFEYQCRLACGEHRANEIRQDWLAHHRVQFQANQYRGYGMCRPTEVDP